MEEKELLERLLAIRDKAKVAWDSISTDDIVTDINKLIMDRWG